MELEYLNLKNLKKQWNVLTALGQWDSVFLGSFKDGWKLSGALADGRMG